MRDRLSGAFVVLSGASGGFGRALTKRLILQHGCTVLGIGRSGEKMEALRAELGPAGENFSYRLFDVRERAAWLSLAAELEGAGRVPDVLINNAGILPRFARWQPGSSLGEVLETDFHAALYGAEAFLPLLERSGRGMLDNVSSAAAFFPIAGTAAYSAAKGALYNFALALREERRGKVTVGLLCPGFSDTDIFRDQAEKRPGGIVKRVCTPPDKIAKKMLRAMGRGKALAVIGKDARLMRICAALLPVSSLRLTRAILKKSGLSLFDGIFKE